MTEPTTGHLHYVTITDRDGFPGIAFTCRGDETADCHQYPDCRCESWDAFHEHPKVSHPECWLKMWFDSDGTDPMGYSARDETITDAGYRIGMSGPIKTYFCQDYVEWYFLDPEAAAAGLPELEDE